MLEPTVRQSGWQRFARHHHPAQGRELPPLRTSRLYIAQQLSQQRRHALRYGRRAIPQPVEQGIRIHDDIGIDDMHSPADQQYRQVLPDRDIKA
ncbi:hypothetical protein PA598K_02984 [Paenibacillus sp. 598K]|nr:hypothetical protein PA598K_02984 [Paenibacillus sp. 598K]